MADGARPEQQTYASSGVDTDEAAKGLSGLLRWVSQTAAFADGVGSSPVPGGFFAAVLPLDERLSLAISTDGVGSKSVLAQLTGDFESIGWDCVAVNVNDIVCTGARPIALVDYIALQHPHGDMLAALGKGMRDAAERARVAIVGANSRSTRTRSPARARATRSTSPRRASACWRTARPPSPARPYVRATRSSAWRATASTLTG